MCKGPEVGKILPWEACEKTCVTGASWGRREGQTPGLWGRQGQIMLCLTRLGFSLRKLGSLWRALSSQGTQYDLGFKVSVGKGMENEL